MREIVATVYRQNNPYGRFDDMRKVFKADLSVFPVRERTSILIRVGYHDIAVVNGSIPEEIYFNGVANGIDCPCCGDRWDERDVYEEVSVYVFDNLEEFSNEAHKMQSPYFIILEELIGFNKDASKENQVCLQL